MESLDLKQLAAMVQVIADEKGLPERIIRRRRCRSRKHGS